MQCPDCCGEEGAEGHYIPSGLRVHKQLEIMAGERDVLNILLSRLPPSQISERQWVTRLKRHLHICGA